MTFVGGKDANAAKLSPWADLDSLRRRPAMSSRSATRFAFYGRCSTEDHQDPETSRLWQLRIAEHLIASVGGVIVEEYFDVGVTRALPWARRPEAGRLVEALRSRRRGWDAVVVGEGQRCWFGTQFVEVSALFESYSVGVWVPELSGQYDPKNASHFMLMTLTGGMSRGERQRVQQRVREAMAAQVETEGRFQGGTPPYGYVLEERGLHSNPKSAARGVRLNRLALEPDHAKVVRKIFELYLSGRSVRGIAQDLSQEGIPTVSEAKRSNVTGKPWAHTTVGQILDNPRYTGYEVWGRTERVEELVDRGNVGLGHSIKLSANPDAPVRSRELAHDPIVTVAEFTLVQQMRARRKASATPPEEGAHSFHPVKTSKYSLSGRIRCALCGGAMEGQTLNKSTVYYRCHPRKSYFADPSNPAHPATVNLREDRMMPLIAERLTAAFAGDGLEATIDGASASQRQRVPNLVQAALEELAQIELKLSRLAKAIEAGIDAHEIRTRIDALNEEHRATTAHLSILKTSFPEVRPDEGDLRAIPDLLAAIEAQQEASDLRQYYREIGLEVTYLATDKSSKITISPGAWQPFEI